MEHLPQLSRSDCHYQAYYCEENAWHLSQHPALATWERYVTFISNPTQTAVLWGQRAAEEFQPILWDYHVIVVAQTPTGSSYIWDLDTVFGFPLPAQEYLQRTFYGYEGWPEEYRPMFRVVPVGLFVEHFGSDRSHMLDENGEYRQPPPPWPLIQNKQQSHTLASFISMQEQGVGDVLNVEEMKRRFA